MNARIPVLLMVRELDLGGTEYNVSKLVRHLDPCRFQPHVACYVPFGVRWNEIAAAGIPILHLPVSSLHSASAWQSAFILRRYVRAHAIQVLHTFDFGTNLFGIPVGRVSRIPIVISSHLWLPPPTGRRSLLHVLHDLSLRKSSAVFTNCQAVRLQLLEQGHLKRQRVFVSYNGVERDIFFPPPGGRRSLSDDSVITIGTVAVLRPEKDLLTILDAFAKLCKTGARIRLVIAGSGPMLPQLEAHRRLLNLTDSCQLLSRPESVADLMRTIDIFISSSRSEAFSNALLEAMACGCCPVGSRVGGTPELIEEGNRGLLFQAGNPDDLSSKLRFLLANPAALRRFGDESARFTHHSLSIEAAAARLASFYTRLLEVAKR